MYLACSEIIIEAFGDEGHTKEKSNEGNLMKGQ